MFINILLVTTVIVYLFALVNILWLKIKLKPKAVKYIQTIHFILLPLFLLSALTSLFSDTTIYYAGYYTNPIIFWGFIITGFMLVGFKFRVIKNKLVKIYLFLFQYVWLTLIVVGIIIPFMGIMVLYSFKPFAEPHGKTVYENNSYRIDEQGTGLLLAPRYKKFYHLVNKKGLYETKISFGVYSEIEGMPTVTSAKINAVENDSALVTLSFEEDIIIDIDSTSKTITQKIATE